jgi:hypothetical protein
MKTRLITLTLSLVGIFFWGCEKGEDLTPKTVSATSEENSYAYKSCCTRTQGYWKNHCDDYTWKYISDKGCETYFYKCEATYLDVLNTPTKGREYYILAHQFIAAKLNLLYCKHNFCKDVDYCKYAPYKVIHAYKEADKYFCTYKPDYKCSDEEKEYYIKLAGILDQYNNGYLGPRHCDEVEKYEY